MKLMNIRKSMMHGTIVFVIASFLLIIVEGQQNDYYQKEERLFKRIKLFFNRRDSNSSIVPNNEEAFGLVYLAYLTFWMFVNSKICFLLFSGELLHQDSELAANCEINFNKLMYAFYIFKENIEHFLDIANETGHEYGGDGQIEFAASQMLSLSLDFMLITEVSNKIGPDDYIEGIITWSRTRNVEVNGQYFKNIFSSYHYVRLLVERGLKLRKRRTEPISPSYLGRRPSLSKYNIKSCTTSASSSSRNAKCCPDEDERTAWKEFITSEYNPTIADIHEVLTEDLLWHIDLEILDEIHDIFARKIGGRTRYSKIINGFRDTFPENEKIWRLMNTPDENTMICTTKNSEWLVEVFNLIRLLRKLEQNV